MSKKEKQNYFNATIWINLFIGIYNLYVFIEINSTFHLFIGALNIGVWVFNRHRLTSIFNNISLSTAKKK
tara:strand:+ start:1180 stop:1389 length:210 start_codon:yes stop_codon:yes gene_type:complete